MHPRGRYARSLERTSSAKQHSSNMTQTEVFLQRFVRVLASEGVQTLDFCDILTSYTLEVFRIAIVGVRVVFCSPHILSRIFALPIVNLGHFFASIYSRCFQTTALGLRAVFDLHILSMFFKTPLLC